MPTFEFDEGTTVSAFLTVGNPTTSYTLTSSGVTFTWSGTVAGSGGFIGHYPSTTAGFLSGSAQTDGGDVFTLDASGAGQTQFGGTVQANLTSIFGSVRVTFHGSTVGQDEVRTATATGLVSATGQFTHISFTTLNAFDYFFLNDLTATVNCFCAGTAIATPDGPRPVETLRPGMRILTAGGGETKVKWLGEQPVATRFLHPAKVNPICVQAGALADGVPSRDLFVSPDHAICIDGLLINAGALVNGSTICQVAGMPLDGFTYYHVETDAHEVLLAENCQVESFIDYSGRDSFVNSDEREGAPAIEEMDMIRISTARLVPETVRARLEERRQAFASPRAA